MLNYLHSSESLQLKFCKVCTVAFTISEFVNFVHKLHETSSFAVISVETALQDDSIRDIILKPLSDFLWNFRYRSFGSFIYGCDRVLREWKCWCYVGSYKKLKIWVDLVSSFTTFNKPHMFRFRFRRVIFVILDVTYTDKQIFVCMFVGRERDCYRTEKSQVEFIYIP
jgi:hypothetical protein